MTDRELLDLAAKAAGAVPKIDLSGQPTAIYAHPPEPGVLRAHSGGWNPLVNDGDALRLACKLSFVVYCDEVEAWCEWGELNEDLEYDHHVSAEPEYRGSESVRRAIVRAAAEIGRSM